MFPSKPPSVLGMMLNLQYENLLKDIVYQAISDPLVEGF